MWLENGHAKAPGPGKYIHSKLWVIRCLYRLRNHAVDDNEAVRLKRSPWFPLRDDPLVLFVKVNLEGWAVVASVTTLGR